MLYDKTPQYPHFSHLPFAKEPFKAIYVFQRLFSTLLLVPIWIIVNLPRSRRPRRSWSLRQVIFVNFTRRIYRVTEVAGVTWGTRNPEEEPKPKELKETRFEWAPPLKERYRAGVVVDRFGRVPYKRVGCFVWRQQVPNGKYKRFGWFQFEMRSNGKKIVEDEIPVIGIFCHGGGYSQLSAHEKSRTSHIPRRLMKDRLFTEIYAVEYRLLQHAPLPAVIMDAAAAYAHVIEKYYGSDYMKPPEPPTRKPCKIVLLGDSSGGNLVLALARWVRDEQLLPMPDGLLLFSPSCDTSHAFPSTQSSYIPRPNENTDYLTDTPEPRALMQRTFLGFKYRPGGTGWGEWKRGRSRDG
jgi:acetyl esterase/lipase